MNRVKYAELLDKVSRQSSNMSIRIATDKYENTDAHLLAIDCLRLLLTEAELLLKKDESNQPQPPISQTPMLGKVPQGMNAQQEDVSPAVGGEAPVVGQNEQTKEVWPNCNGDELTEFGLTICCMSCGNSWGINRLAASAPDK